MKLMAGLLIAAGMLMVVGCGRGDSTASSLTKAEFTEKVNQMCKKEKQERTKAEDATQARLGIDASELPTPAQQAKIVEASVPFYEKVTRQMQELVPSDQAAKIAPLVEEREEVAEIVRQGGPSQPALAAIYKANQAALQYGLDECSI